MHFAQEANVGISGNPKQKYFQAHVRKKLLSIHLEVNINQQYCSCKNQLSTIP
jgi:hypothetical protein